MLQDTARRIAKVSIESKMPLDEEEYVLVCFSAGTLLADPRVVLQGGAYGCRALMVCGIKVFRDLQND